MKKSISIPKNGGSWLSRLVVPSAAWKKLNLDPVSEITPEAQFMYGAGVTSVATLLNMHGKKTARQRQLIYEKWMVMESDPIISSAIHLLVTAALGGHESTGDLVFIEKKTDIAEDKKLSALVDEISADLTPLFNRVAYQVAYTAAIFGDAYARIYSDKSGVVDLYVDELVRPPLVQAFEQGSKTIGFTLCTSEKNNERLDIRQMSRMKMPRSQWIPQFGVLEKNIRLHLTEDEVTQLPILPSMVGGSLLFNAEEPYDNLSASLLGLVGQRWVDSIDEQLLTVNLDGTTKEQQALLIDSLKKMLLTSKQVAENAVKKGKPNLDRIRHILPVFGDKQLVQLSGPAGSGRTSNITVEDVMFHAKLLAGALGVDLSMIGFADIMSGGLGEGGFFRTSAQVAEKARVIRVSLAEFFDSIIDVHTLMKYGAVFERKERPWNVNFFGSISALEAERQRTRTDAMNAGLSLIQGMQMLKEMGADKQVMAAFLTKNMMLDEDDAELYATIADAPGGAGQGFEGEEPPRVEEQYKEEEAEGEQPKEKIEKKE